jgi:uncharacterized protein YjbJ (UPF0337 family)
MSGFMEKVKDKVKDKVGKNNDNDNDESYGSGLRKRSPDHW